MSRPLMKLTRRDFLAGSAAALVGASLPYRQEKPNRSEFAFFSDSHVSLERNIKECRTMLAEVEQLNPALIINGGDVTDYGWQKEYANYQALIKGFSCPVHHVPGNHDVRWSPLGLKAYSQVCGQPFRFFQSGGVHFLLLDSTVPLSHYGHYEGVELRALEKYLANVPPTDPLLVFTHHWVGRGKKMIDNEDDLYRVLAGRNIIAIFNGHGHSDLLWDWYDIPCTMNKGLYQFSWQKVVVDHDANKLSVSRRAGESSAQALLFERKIKGNISRKWVVASQIGQASELGLSLLAGATHYRWDNGAWIAADTAFSPKSGPIGYHSYDLKSPTSLKRTTVRSESPSGPLKQAWVRNIDAGVQSHIIVHKNDILVSAMSGEVICLQQADGVVKWKASTKGYCHSSPAVKGSRVFVGSADGGVYAFDATSGKQLWRFETGGPVYATCGATDDVVCAASGSGVIVGLDPASGHEVWRYKMPASETAFSQSQIATDGSRFFIGAWDNALYALDCGTGKLVWKAGCCGERSFHYSAAIANPLVVDGTLYIAANGNVLYAFDAASGREVWSATATGDKFGYSSPSLAGESVVIGCLGEKGQVRSITRVDGAEKWVCELGSDIYDSSPAIGDDFCALLTVTGLLGAIKLSDGTLIGSFQMPEGHALSSPAVVGRRIFAATYNNRVIALDLAQA